MPEIPLINSQAQGDYPKNLYYVPEWENGRPALLGTPGEKVYLDLSGSSVGAVRGMEVMNNKLYALVGQDLWEIISPTSKIDKGNIDTWNGRVFMANNGNDLVIVVPEINGWVFDATADTLTQIIDPDFGIPTSLLYIDTYFVITLFDSEDILKCVTGDPTDWNALHYETMGRLPDKAVGVYEVNGDLWGFGTQTRTVYYHTGSTPEFPWDPVRGGFFKEGLAARFSPSVIDNSLFFLDDHRQVRRSRGYQTRIVSTHQINRRFARMTKVDDAIGFTFVYQGQNFYALCFPSEEETWLFNASTSIAMRADERANTVWCQWASKKSGSGATEDGRHRSNCYAYYDNKHLVGDHETGIIYELDEDTYDDNGALITADLILPSIHQDRKLIRHNSFELETKAGVGIVGGSDNSEDPQAMLRFSDNDRQTWSHERWKTLGESGKHKTLTKWRRIGSSRNRAYWVRITAPVERVIKGAYLK